MELASFTGLCVFVACSMKFVQPVSSVRNSYCKWQTHESLGTRLIRNKINDGFVFSTTENGEGTWTQCVYQLCHLSELRIHTSCSSLLSPSPLSPHWLSIASCPTPPPSPSPPSTWPLPLSSSPCPLTSYVPLPFPFPVFPSTWSLTHYLLPTLLCTLGFFQGSPPKFSAMSKVPVDNLKPTPFSQPPIRIFPVPLYHYYSPPLSSPFFFHSPLS